MAHLFPAYRPTLPRRFRAIVTAVFALSIAPTVLAAPGTDDLVLYWKFDESEGTVAADDSGDGNTGTHANGPTISNDVPALNFPNANSLSFNGVNNYVEAPLPALPASFSITGWLNRNDTELDIIVNHHEAGEDHSGWRVQTSGNLLGLTYANVADYIFDSLAIPTSQWVFFAIVVDGSTATGYLDGDSQSLPVGSMQGTPDTFWIGSWAFAGFAYSYAGLIDDVRVYSRALSEDEVADLAAGNHTSATWNGNSSTDPETASNWDINAVPDPYTNLIIADVANDPVATAAFSGSSLTIQSGAGLTLGSHAFEMTDSGTFSNDGILKLNGSSAQAQNVTNDTDSGSVEYTGSSTYLSLAMGNAYYDLVFNGAGGTWSPSSSVTVAGELRTHAGTYNASGQTTTVAGAAKILGGTYQCSTATQTFNGGLTVGGGTVTGSSGQVDVNGTLTMTGGTLTAPSGTLTVSGNWTKQPAATFSHNDGTVSLDGANQTINGSTVFHNLQKSVATARTLTFESGTTTTVENALTLAGADGQLLSLRSSVNGADAALVLSSGGTQNVAYLDVRDIDSSGGEQLVCEDVAEQCVDSGNNTNWQFTDDIDPPVVQSLSPTDDATGVSPSADLVITFDEAVDVETGNVTIFRASDDVEIEAIDVTSLQVTGGGTTTITINPSVTLADETGYYVQIDATAFDDAAGNSYAGIADETTWNFTTGDSTAPVLQSFTSTTPNGTYGPTQTINITATYNEALAGGSTLTVILDNGESVVLNSVASSAVSGTYTVGATGSGEDSADLTVASISSESVSDVSANTRTNSSVPGSPNNIAHSSAIVIDATAPSAPGTPDLAAGSDSGNSSTDDLTNDTTPTLTSSCESGATVQLLSGASVLGSGTCAASTVSITSSALSDQSYSLRMRQTDPAGNVSSQSTPLVVVIDTTAPALAEVTAVSTPSTDITPDYTFSSTQSGAIVYGGDCSSATAEAVPGNNTVTFAALSDGPHSNCTVTVTDAAGNTSSALAVTAFTIDTAGPFLLTFTTSASNGTYGPGRTIEIVATYDETLAAGSELTVTLSNGVTLTLDALSGATASGTYTVGATGSGHDDSDLTVDDIDSESAVDGLGNTRTNSSVPAGAANLGGSAAIVIDTTAPTVQSLSPADGATTVSITANLVITFDEPIGTAGTGTITLYRGSDDSVVEAFAVTGALVTGSGTATITINPTFALEQNAAYYVLIDEFAFADPSGNRFAGLSDATAWNFVAGTPAASSSSSAPAEQQQSGGGGGGGRGSGGPGGRSPAAKLARETLLNRFYNQLASGSRSSAPAVGQQPSSGSSSSAPAVAGTSSAGKRSVGVKRGHLEMVLSDKTVIAPVVYRDVPINAWFAPYVSALIEEGIAEGYKDETGKHKGEFGVENPVTYAEIAKMVLEASRRDLSSAKSPRNPSAAGTWAAPYISIAEQLQFSVLPPDRDVMQPATRGEVVQSILEAFGVSVTAKNLASFADVPETHPFAPAITLAFVYGIVDGDTDASGNPTGTFRPDEPVNRAEVAKMLALAKKLLTK